MLLHSLLALAHELRHAVALLEEVGELEALAALPRLAVVRVAGEQWEEGGEFAEDHLPVDDVDLAPTAGFAEGAA